MVGSGDSDGFATPVPTAIDTRRSLNFSDAPEAPLGSTPLRSVENSEGAVSPAVALRDSARYLIRKAVDRNALLDNVRDLVRPDQVKAADYFFNYDKIKQQIDREACAACARMKNRRPSPKKPANERYDQITPGATWAVDTTGPHEPIGFDGSRYRWTFVELTARYTLIYCSARKSDYIFVLAHFVHDVQQIGFSNFMVEHVTGKISQISRVILHTSGMDLSYWPLSDVHSALLWNILPHDGPKDVIPYHALRGHRFTYRRLEIFGALCHVAMDEQQMRDRRAGVSKKYLDRAWPGRFVGIELKSSAYKVLDLEKNVVTDVGDPQFVRRYDDFGQVMLSFPDPDTEPET
eukprot:gene7776-9241_t